MVDTSVQNWMARLLVGSSPVYKRASVNKVADGAGDRSGSAAIRRFSSPMWSIMLEVSMTLKEVGAPSVWP